MATFRSRREYNKTYLEHIIVSDSEGLKLLGLYPKVKLRGPHWPDIGQFQHQQGQQWSRTPNILKLINSNVTKGIPS